MRRTLQIILTLTVAFGVGCGSITVVDDGSEGDDNSAARGEADGGQPPVSGNGVTSTDAGGGQSVVVAACSATHNCDDGNVCNLVNGTCVECLLDGDCHRGKHSRCDTARFVCLECFSDDDCDDDKRCNTAGECK
jgi:hypothetical protein